MSPRRSDKTTKLTQPPAKEPIVVRLSTILGWVVCLTIGAVTTWAMTAALLWGGLAYLLVAFAMPLALTWFLLPPARTHRWWRWLAVLFVATQTAYPFTVFASTVAIGWLVHTLYLVEFADHPDNKVLAKIRAPRGEKRPTSAEKIGRR